jgi:serine phosphatase RsbU (regulator of sigma subunit)/CHASE2 domain-containing sensor protein
MTDSKSPFKPDRRGSRVWRAWAIVLILATILSLAIGGQTRRMLFDAWQRISPRTVSAPDVRVVLIDGKSLGLVGPWPWSRYYLARLTEDIAKQGAKVIAFDVLFPEPDRVNPALFAKLYPELSAASSSEVSALPSMDQLFGQVIGRSPVVIARAGAEDGVREGLTVDAQITGTLPRHVGQWPAAITAIPELEDVALGHGLINGQPDSDGTVRSIPLVMRVAGRPMPGFAMEIARVGLGASGFRVTPHSVQLANRNIPIDARGRMHFRFGTFPENNIISAAIVLGDATPPGFFTGKTVLIGLAAEGTADIVSTPLAAENYGSLVQAQAVDTMMSGSGWLARPAWTSIVEWTVAALMALLALFAAWRGRAPKIALAIGLIALPIASWLAFDRLALLLDATRPLLIGSGALAGVVIGLFADARRDRERLRETLVEERVAAAQTEGELKAAREIQMSMVPPRSKLAKVDPRLDVDALLEPARSVGGDLYDLARLDDDRVGFMIGDVTGKGVPAALFMAMSKALTSFVLNREYADLAVAVTSVNEELLRGGGDTLSVTMIIGIIDLRTGSVSLVCAGHEDPITLAPGGKAEVHRLEGGPPLGLADYDYPVEPLRLSPGDALILVTDGITEAQNPKDELYGRQQILTEVARQPGSATELCEGIRDAVRNFEGGLEPTDDLTVMVLRYLGPAA